MRPDLTTLCYIERGDEYLMLHRVKKENDVNRDKWIGVGGHFEEGESPEDCLLREVYEETGLTLKSWRFCGIVTFCFTPEKELKPAGLPHEMDGGTKLSCAAQPLCEYMHLYTAQSYEGTLKVCDEGELVWVKKDRIDRLPVWEGDRIFLKLIREQSDFFFIETELSGKCSYGGGTGWKTADASGCKERLMLPDRE